MNFNILARDSAWIPSKKDPPWNVMADLMAEGGRFFFGVTAAGKFKAVELKTKADYNAAVKYLREHTVKNHSFYMLPPFEVQLWSTASSLKYK